MSLASDERRALADALLRAGPDAPTLCEGWTVRDLAAHLVARERRPDTLPGLAVPPLAGWTEKVRRELATRPLEELVAEFRSGPPRLSVFGLPGVDARANLTEHFVHHEDVRRAQPGWKPRDLPERERAALWRVVSERGRVLYRRADVGVVLVVPDGPRRQVRPGSPSVVLTGGPEELLLHAMGRTGQARVEVTGPADAVRRFGRTPLGI
jgi:uncharacterized protein (TIGR03085 family)